MFNTLHAQVLTGFNGIEELKICLEYRKVCGGRDSVCLTGATTEMRPILAGPSLDYLLAGR